ncbi:uncharacterized protein M6B38_307995 [Iris pallida]|uniref:Transport inhibitor response 1-like protein n=1 Tax=Iris pallida TaxID=29817 RepID=A0AAX6HKA0_IRIPA|nr:uncharacterized protein M6B38_307995 [Iris pallida]
MREEARSDMSEDDGDGSKKDRWAPDLGGGSAAKIRTTGAVGGDGTREPSLLLCPGPPPPFSDRVLENVLEDVLQFLTSRRDRNSASLVCRSWHRAEARTRRELFVGNCYAVAPSRAVQRFGGVESLVLKGKPRFADFSLVPLEWGARLAPWVSAAAPAYPCLQKLCVKRMAVSDSDLGLVARCCPGFRELSLVCCDGFTSAGLAVIAANCRKIRVLDLIEVYLEDDGDEGEETVDWISMFPDTVTCLESLSFECIAGPINFEALESLVSRSPALRQLRVGSHVTASQLQRLMLRAPSLTHLGTGSFKSNAVAGHAPQEVENLASAFAAARSVVCLSGFSEISPELLPAIYPVCANLISLNFSVAQITADQLRPVILQCHNLKKFWVLDTVRDEGLQMVAATCKDLQEIRVFPLDPREGAEALVSDVGLTAISEGCPKLQSILYFSQQMTNAAVVSMARNCRDLVVFRLCIMGRHQSDRLTLEPMDEGFGAIVMNCKKLTRLAVSGLLTDRAFAYIGEHGKSVRTLSVAFAGSSDMALRYVLEGCSKLQKLEIRDCPYGDLGLLSGIHHYYNMRFLWMSSCKLTLRGCKEVAQRLPHLVLEDIRDRANDDGEAVEKLYLYRSLAGPRNDAPPFVKIL